MKLVFDQTNSRVVTDTDEHVFYTDELESPDQVIENVVTMFNEGELLDSIDEYLLDQEETTQEAREIIVEALYDVLRFTDED